MAKISRESVESANDGFFERVVQMANESKVETEDLSEAAREYHDPAARKAARWAWCLRDVDTLERIFSHEGKSLDDIIRDAIDDYL